MVGVVGVVLVDGVEVVGVGVGVGVEDFKWIYDEVEG